MSSVVDPIRFDQLQLGASLLQAVTDLGYETPSPIQAQSIPVLLSGQNLLGQAQTGTGKTAAFALPALENIDIDKRAPQVLVLTPTRELAIQVSEAFSAYARHLAGLSVLTVYGGQAMHLQLRALKRGPQIIVGTPGRIMDHLRRKTLPLEHLRLLVLDEADEMLKMGFIEDVETILEQTPETRQLALFSATMPLSIRKIARRYMPEAEEIKIAAKTATVDAVEQRYWLTAGTGKKESIVRLLDTESYDAMLIFVRTRSETTVLADYLTDQGYGAAALNGDMTQALREATIAKLRRGKLNILVATDVAARGLDVERISHVINYDIPYDAETYVHRIGRTARAGRGGSAITFITARERHLLRTIEKTIKCPIKTLDMPKAAAVVDKRVAEFKDKLAATLEQNDLDFYREILESFCSERAITPADAAAALLYWAQKERPFQVRELSTPAPGPEYRVKSGGKKTAAGPHAKVPRKSQKEPHNRREIRKKEHNHEFPMFSYRLEIGREHNVRAGDIVGAIANEAGLDSRHIGRIRLFDDYSTVDLPEMPKPLLKHLRKTWIRNRQLRISLFEENKKAFHKAAA